MSIPTVAAAHWRSDANGMLLVGDHPVSSITERYGTPLFIYDRAIIEKKISSLREALPRQFRICYSVKANPTPAILKVFLEHECGLEVASAGEFFLALSAGCRPENVVFAGPGKTVEELELVIAHDVGEIHAESQKEIERINAISRRHDIRTRIAIRINPNEEGQGGAMRMGGKSSPFGVDEEQMDGLLARLSDYPHIEFCGIHLFVGTQILDSAILLTQYEKALEIFRRAAAHMGNPPWTMDFGGGLGIPYFQGETELDLERVKIGMQRLVADVERDDCFVDTNFVVEPGRFLVGEAGIYVARVNDVKYSRGKKYLILDGGMNHHLAASGNLGQVIKKNFPMATLNKLKTPASEVVEVVGPLCTPLDTLGRSVQLPAAEVGDLVGIFQSGAYARSASPLGFLSHPTPPEVLIEGAEDFLIRARGNVKEIHTDFRQVGVGESFA